MSAVGTKLTMDDVRSLVRYRDECVAKLFSRLKPATLIQERTQMRNIDSNVRPVGFEYCALAARRRVLQHIRQSGPDLLNLSFSAFDRCR
jgi:hypothetical protein